MAIPRAVVLTCVLVALVPLAASATPSPSPVPSPSPSPKPSPTPTLGAQCSIPPGLEADPQEQQLKAQCVAQANLIQDQKNKLSNSLGQAHGSAVSLQEMLSQTRQAVTDIQTEQDKTRQEIQDLEVRQALTAQQIESTKQRLSDRRDAYSAFIRRSYKYQPNLWAYLFSSSGISDFLGRLAALFQIRHYGLDLLRAVHDEKTRLTHHQEQLKGDRETAIKKEGDLKNAQKDLIDNEVKEAAILSALQGSISAGQNMLASADSQSAAILAQIVAAQIAREDWLIQQADDAAWGAAQAWLATNRALYPTSQGHSSRYAYIWPAQSGVITQGFGPSDYAPEPPAFGFPHFHSGIDVANSSGTPIFAADDGVVVAAETSMLGSSMIGYGRHVIIAHRNSYMTLYGHLDAYIVKPGDQVVQGQLIGVMGSTGMSSGSHLHLEVRVNNIPVDPAPYLPPAGPNDFRG
jgi:murein DD-endopeptidase MepM/ murein hydrolase activator NlpD